MSKVTPQAERRPREGGKKAQKKRKKNGEEEGKKEKTLTKKTLIHANEF